MNDEHNNHEDFSMVFDHLKAKNEDSINDSQEYEMSKEYEQQVCFCTQAMEDCFMCQL